LQFHFPNIGRKVTDILFFWIFGNVTIKTTVEMVAMIFYFWILIQFNNQVYRFQYMAMADDRRRIMPFPEDRLPGRCQPLAYQEAVLLVNPKDPQLKGEVLVAKPNTLPQ
jgi:hypothetical protein